MAGATSNKGYLYHAAGTAAGACIQRSLICTLITQEGTYREVTDLGRPDAQQQALFAVTASRQQLLHLSNFLLYVHRRTSASAGCLQQQLLGIVAHTHVSLI